MQKKTGISKQENIKIKKYMKTERQNERRKSTKGPQKEIHKNKEMHEQLKKRETVLKKDRNK